MSRVCLVYSLRQPRRINADYSTLTKLKETVAQSRGIPFVYLTTQRNYCNPVSCHHWQAVGYVSVATPKMPATNPAEIQRKAISTGWELSLMLAGWWIYNQPVIKPPQEGKSLKYRQTGPIQQGSGRRRQVSRQTLCRDQWHNREGCSAWQSQPKAPGCGDSLCLCCQGTESCLGAAACKNKHLDLFPPYAHQAATSSLLLTILPHALQIRRDSHFAA